MAEPERRDYQVLDIEKTLKDFSDRIDAFNKQDKDAILKAPDVAPNSQNFSYDAAGRVTAVTSQTQATNFTYNAAGRTQSKADLQYLNGKLLGGVIDFCTYDAKGKRVHAPFQIEPDGHVLESSKNDALVSLHILLKPLDFNGDNVLSARETEPALNPKPANNQSMNNLINAVAASLKDRNGGALSPMAINELVEVTNKLNKVAEDNFMSMAEEDYIGDVMKKYNITVRESQQQQPTVPNATPAPKEIKI